ncbi:iron-sulfur cluster biosynthesis protein [Amycolatopsis sp. lyj-90]|uniref:iron-sulfur cluster biosynthesis protein n=1 Tax=Amycolatopsis sp. lyj-90 TaxID=2789285 RepID=UPI00397E3D40
MFTVTESAIEAITKLVQAGDVQSEGGLRLSLDGLPENGAKMDVEVAARPAPGDDVIATAGTQVFLARDTRVRLTDKVLDVRKDVNGHYTFLITSEL